jgi:hypothetical protein
MNMWQKKCLLGMVVTAVVFTAATIAKEQGPQIKVDSGKAKILVEGRFFTVDANGPSVADFLTKTLKIAPCDNSTPNKDGQYGFILTNEQAKALTKWLQLQKEARMLQVPKVTVLDGEQANINITTDVSYIKEYKEPNEMGGQPEPVPDTITVGTKFDVTPKLQSDTQAIFLDMKCQLTNVVKWTKIPYKTGGKGNVPEVNLPEIVQTEGKTQIAVPQDHSLLMPMGLVHEEIKTGLPTKASHLYLLVKAAVEPNKAEPHSAAAAQDTKAKAEVWENKKSQNERWNPFVESIKAEAVAFSKPFEEKGQTWMTVAHNIKGKDVCLVVIDDSGTEHAAAQTITMGASTFTQLTVAFDIPLANITAFQLKPAPKPLPGRERKNCI